uniref:Uncharacterized protein n=1 Tax=Oryza brachyantha TaxID=4533 RepID=J3M4V4_ORYBR
MASSHAIVATILCLLLLASSQSLVVVVSARVRMTPTDRPQASVATADTASSSTSHELLQEFMAPPRPRAAVAGNASEEVAAVGAKRRRVIQVQGSVPSPGVGHH